MDDILFVGFAVRFVYATLGLIGIFYTLILFNRLTGNRFDAAYELIMANPMAAAVYSGIRLYAIFYFYARILG